MKANFLYIDGQYVHNEKELLTRINELNKKNADATTILLADLYRNGYLKTFLQKWVNKELLINEDSDDWEIAKKIKSAIDKEDKIDLSINVSDYCTINSIKIVRADGDEIRVQKAAQGDKNTLRFWVNGYCKSSDENKSVNIIISYSVKREFNAKIDVYLEQNKVTSINLSKKCENAELTLNANESILDPWKDNIIKIGEGNGALTIVLKAPQIPVLFYFNNKEIIYPMTHILKDNPHDNFYIGIWPFEYNNEDDWRNKLSGNWFFDTYYSKRKINFYIVTPDSFKITSNDFSNNKSIFLSRIRTLNDVSLDFPTKEEWEYVAQLNNVNQRGSIISEIKGQQTFGLSSKDLENNSPNTNGVYAMLGNIYELAVTGNTPFLMGGTLKVIKEDSLRALGGRIQDDNLVGSAFFCIRFVIHHTENIMNKVEIKANIAKSEDAVELEYEDMKAHWG